MNIRDVKEGQLVTVKLYLADRIITYTGNMVGTKYHKDDPSNTKYDSIVLDNVKNKGRVCISNPILGGFEILTSPQS